MAVHKHGPHTPVTSGFIGISQSLYFPMTQKRRTLLETRRFAVVEETVIRPDSTSASCTFITHPGSVAILPLVDDEHVCLIHSRRLTVGETLIEVPAGTREPNETPLATARRELVEETGYRAARFDELISFYPSPGISNERMWIFVATGLTAGTGPRGQRGNRESSSFMERGAGDDRSRRDSRREDACRDHAMVENAPCTEFRSKIAATGQKLVPTLPQQPIFNLVGMVQIVQRQVADHDEHAVVRILLVLGRDGPFLWL